MGEWWAAARARGTGVVRVQPPQRAARQPLGLRVAAWSLSSLPLPLLEVLEGGGVGVRLSESYLTNQGRPWSTNGWETSLRWSQPGRAQRSEPPH